MRTKENLKFPVSLVTKNGWAPFSRNKIEHFFTEKAYLKGSIKTRYLEFVQFWGLEVLRVLRNFQKVGNRKEITW